MAKQATKTGVSLVDNAQLTINVTSRTTLADLDSQVSAAEKMLNARPILSGIGLEDGNYTFTTAKDADFVVLRPVTSTKTGEPINYLLSGLVGTVTGDKLASSKTFDEKTMFTVPLDMVKKAEPNQAYSFKVAGGRVTTFIKVLANAKV